jgi:glycosidase
MIFDEMKFYGDVGSIYPYDVRYEPTNPAFCNPESEDRVQFHLHTEPGFAEARLVYNDGTLHTVPMHCCAVSRRWSHWEATIEPRGPSLDYSFALKTDSGRPVYYCKRGIAHAVAPLDRWHLDMRNAKPLQTPRAMQGAFVYHIFPERFARMDPNVDPPETVPWGSPPKAREFQGGHLLGILAHLDHLQAMGVNAVYCTPILTSRSTHKYYAEDYCNIDPAFGGNDAFHTLVDALHKAGMQIIVDASFNHCHPKFHKFQDWLQNGEQSEHRSWFSLKPEYAALLQSGSPIRVLYRPHMAASDGDHARIRELKESFTRETGIPVVEADGDGALIEPTYVAWYDDPYMPQLNLRNPATRAYFLHVAAHWIREFNIDGWRMDVTDFIDLDFWREFRSVTKAIKPECFLLAEIWGSAVPWLQGDMFDATMNYTFRDMCVDYFARASMSTATLLDGVTRMQALYAPQVTDVNLNLLSSHDVERFLHMSNGDIKRLKLTTLFQFTMPGAPSVYYGDEIGMTGGKDPDCRRAYPWHQPGTWDRSMFEMVCQLARLRREYPTLRFGDWRPIPLPAHMTETIAYERKYQGESIWVLINRAGCLDRITLQQRSRVPQMLWGDAKVSANAEGLVIENVAPWSGVVIRLREA